MRIQSNVQYYCYVQKESSLLPDQQEVPEIIEVMNSSCDVEFDNDMGYSSHDSSCLQEEGSDKSWRQNPQGASKDVSCEDSPSKPIIDWSYNEDDSMQGVDEVEDLLYHFGMAFDKFSALQLFCFFLSITPQRADIKLHYEEFTCSNCLI